MTTEERIVALERKLTRTRTLFAAVLVAGVGLACVGQVNPVREVIRAKRIEVVGENGKVRVGLETKDNLGIITTYNDDEQRLVRITGNPKEKSGGVVAYNGKGQDLVFLGANTEGNGMVATKNGKGQALVLLGATTDGQGVVATLNGKGQDLVLLGATAKGHGTVRALNGEGQTLVLLGANTDGQGVVATKNGKGQALAVLGGNNGGNGAPNAPNPNPQADKPIGAAGNAQPSLEKLQAFPQRYVGKTQVYKGIEFGRSLMQLIGDDRYFLASVVSEKGNHIQLNGNFYLVVEADIAEQITEHQKDGAYWPNSTIECVVIKTKSDVLVVPAKRSITYPAPSAPV